MPDGKERVLLEEHILVRAGYSYDYIQQLSAEDYEYVLLMTQMLKQEENKMKSKSLGL